MINFEDTTPPDAVARPFITFAVPPPTVGGPNGLFNVQLEDGRVFTVEMPEGCRVGDIVHAVVVDDEATGNSSLVLIPCDDKPSASAAPLHNDPVNQDEEIDSTEYKQPKVGKKTFTAVTAGGIIGTLLAGPIVGAVVVGVMIIGVTVPNTIAYQHAKEDFKQTALGRQAVTASQAASVRIKEVDEKLRVSESVKSARDTAVTKAKAVDERYEISEKATVFTTAVGAKVSSTSESVGRHIKDADEKYKISENAKSTAKSVAEDLKVAGGFFASRASMLYRDASKRFCSEEVSPERRAGQGSRDDCDLGQEDHNGRL